MGTPYYLSPEIIEGKDYNFKTDIWSMGVILYELCMRKPPFDANCISSLALKIVRGIYTPIQAHYSQDLRRLISIILQYNPDKRPSVDELLCKMLKRISFDKIKNSKFFNH